MPAQLTIVVAVSEDGVIGREGDLPWRLSADLQRFKRITMGHHLLMGRKTYESIGRLLPGRTTTIITRNNDYRVEGAIVGNSLDELLQKINDSHIDRAKLNVADADISNNEIFVVGGGEVYATTLPLATRIHFTRVHTKISGDAFFPKVDWAQWKEVRSEFQPADEKNDFDSTYRLFERQR
jgi:dihydrofolate reductase